MLQLTIEQNQKHLQLQQWENKLHEREMHIVERELIFYMAASNQERSHRHTPRIHKRSGHFMRSLLHIALKGSDKILPTDPSKFISSPTSLFFCY